MKKKLLALCALTCVGALSVSLVACDNKNSSEAASFVSLDINPSIELTLDKNDKVISVYGANEDAQVLLYGEEGIIGMSVESAVSKITELSIELGYINEDNKVIQTSVSASTNTEALQNKINAQINSTATSLDMQVSCSIADAYSLLRKLENVKAQYPDNEKIQALTPQQLKLVISASEAGDITIEAAVQLNTQQLVKMITEAHKNAEQFATEAYIKAKTTAYDAYDKAVGAAVDGIYTSYYMAHHPMNAYYGLAYHGYKTSARGLNALADTLDFIEDVCDYPLDEAQISAIAQALGLGENVDALKNANGEITVKSVEAYADKLFKNSQASAELEAMKAELTTALSNTENAIQQKINELSKEYEPQINAINATITTALNGLEAFIPAGILPQVQQIKTDLTDISAEIAAIVADGKITSDEVRKMAVKLEEKSAASLETIQKDLTEEELEEIKAIQQTAVDRLADEKAKFDNALTQAEQTAKQYLQQMKEERRAN